jgi:hypothetical protein
VRVAGTGGGALLDEHSEEGVEAAKQWVRAAGEGDGARAGGARQNQLVALRLAVHHSPPQSPPGRPWPPSTSCFKCFRRFRLMFEAFHLNVAKVDLGCCICCNNNICMLQAYVFKYFSCFKNMFQVFHHNVAKVYLDVA